MAFLSSGRDEIEWGDTSKNRVVLSARPVVAESPVSLDDAYINSLTSEREDVDELESAILDEIESQMDEE